MAAGTLQHHGPSVSLTVDTDDLSGEGAIRGESVSDLQENIVVGEDEITGTLKYVSDFTGYSEDEDLQKGNFLALHVTSATAGATLRAGLVGGDLSTIGADGIAVLRITSTSDVVQIVASKTDYNSTTNTYELTSLVLTAAPVEEQPGVDTPGTGT